jgi:diguanylate cyclase (GGDEF)-like protein
MERRHTLEPLQHSLNSLGDPPLPESIRSPSPQQDKRLNKIDKKAAFRKDALTGLHGQRYLCHMIDACLEQSRQRNLTATLALLQLENFYEIRSWVGLSEADLLLSDIAQLLKTSLPKRALLCRCHNFEFAVLLIADCSVNARLITDKIKHALLSAVSPLLPRQLELKCGVGLAKLESNIPSWPVVTLSHNSLVSVPFLRWLEGRLSGRRSLASQLVLQISETDALIAQHHLSTFCAVIEKLGCKLSLSDFGCTPKPLRYLSLVPATYVKLDTGLLRKIDMNQANLEFLSCMVEELHERGISVIAPRLEQLPILPPLWQANVDFMQGNCLHRPSSSMNFEFIETQTVSFSSR